MVQKSGGCTSWGKGSLSHYLQGSIHPRWCRISSINSIIQKPMLGDLVASKVGGVTVSLKLSYICHIHLDGDPFRALSPSNQGSFHAPKDKPYLKRKNTYSNIRSWWKEIMHLVHNLEFLKHNINLFCRISSESRVEGWFLSRIESGQFGSLSKRRQTTGDVPRTSRIV